MNKDTESGFMGGGAVLNNSRTSSSVSRIDLKDIPDNIALKQEVRNLRTKLDVLSDNNGEGSSTADVLRRLSNLEKYIYSKD